MIKYLLALAFALPMASYSKEVNNVWLPFSGGNLENVCRMLWATYDTYFNTNTIMYVKQGAGGELASKEMIDSGLANKSICAGSNMILHNRYLFPNIKTYGDEIEMIVKVVNFPVVWYGPNTTPDVKGLEEYINYLKSLKRPINVGVFQGPTSTVARYLTETYNLNTNIVTFKNGPQIYPNLVDGTIDLAFDAGGGINVAEEGKFKILGYMSTGNIMRLKNYKNFSQSNKGLYNIQSWFGIAVPKNSDPEYKKLLSERVVFIINQERFQTFVDSVASNTSGDRGQTLKTFIEVQKNTVDKYWRN